MKYKLKNGGIIKLQKGKVIPRLLQKIRTSQFDKAAEKAFKSVEPVLPAQVKYYGPTMGKSYAAKTNPQLIDLDTWGRFEYDQLAKKYGYKDWREMILSDKGDYNAEYKQLIKDQIRRIQSDPKYNGQTIMVSNASLLNPNSGITFANTPVIPERSIMAIRNNSRHPWESIEHGESWWDVLQQKGTPLKIDNRFVSEIEGNKAIEFVPRVIDPQTVVTTYHFDGRMPMRKHISESEKLGIPKGERFNPKALEDPYYWGYEQWNSRYNDAINSENIKEAQRLRDLHFKIKAPNAPQYDFYHGTFNKDEPFYIFEPQSNNELFFHFSPYKDTAEKFMGIAKTRNKNGRLITAKLNIQRPTTVTDSGWWNWYRIPEANPRISKKLGMNGSTAGRYYSDLLLKEPSVSEANGKMMDMIDADAFMYKNYTEDTGRISIAVPRPTQIKLSDPITRTGKGEIIPIVKRDNFHNLDMRYKQGGTINRFKNRLK